MILLCRLVCALVAAVVCRQACAQSLKSNVSHRNSESVHGKGLILCRDIFHLADECRTGTVTGSSCVGIENKVAFCLHGDRRLGDTHEMLESVHGKGVILCRDIFHLDEQCRDGTVNGSSCDGIEAKVAFCLNGDRRLGDTLDKMESVQGKGLILCRDIFRFADQCRNGPENSSSCDGIESKVAFCLNGDRLLGDTIDNMESVQGKGLILCRDIFHLADQCRNGTVNGSSCDGIEDTVAFCLNGDRRLDDAHDKAGSVRSKGLILCRDIFHLSDQCRAGTVTGSSCDGIEAKVAFCLNGDRRLDDSRDSMDSVQGNDLILCRNSFHLADQCRDGTVTGLKCEGIKDKVAFCLNGDRRLDDTHEKMEFVNDKGLSLCKDIFHLSNQCRAGTVTGSSCEGIEAKVAFCSNGDRRLRGSLRNLAVKQGKRG